MQPNPAPVHSDSELNDHNAVTVDTEQLHNHEVEIHQDGYHHTVPTAEDGTKDSVKSPTAHQELESPPDVQAATGLRSPSKRRGRIPKRFKDYELY